VPQQMTTMLSTSAVVDDLAVADTSTSALRRGTPSGRRCQQRARGRQVRGGRRGARVCTLRTPRRARAARRALWVRVARARTGLEQRSARRGSRKRRRRVAVKPSCGARGRKRLRAAGARDMSARCCVWGCTHTRVALRCAHQGEEEDERERRRTANWQPRRRR
jgi:hypothetical protein